MKTLVVPLFLAAGLTAAGPLLRQSDFQPGPGGAPAGWSLWTPRPETAPRTFVDNVSSRAGRGALAISGNSNPAVCGGWERVVKGIQAGEWYRFSACYRSAGLDYEPRQVVARLDWRTAEGKRAGQPDYAYRTTPDGEWTRVSLDAPAPEGAAAVAIQLLLWYAPRATVWWDDVSLDRIPPPAPRNVTIAAVNLRPRNTGSPEASVSQFITAADTAITTKVDLILLPEGITKVGTSATYAGVAEPVPGPTTGKLGELARRHDAWVAAGIYEREGTVVYNTAVLLDRSGRLAGKYRKVYLPREETEGGMTPGSDYPVFDTDFGKLGMMICWDVQYADPARALALRGAEIILLPIWGGNELLARARAIENHLFLVSSGYSFPTEIVDPEGKVIASAPNTGAVAIATLDLNRRYVDSWLGNMRGRFMKELRLDVPVEPVRRDR